MLVDLDLNYTALLLKMVRRFNGITLLWAFLEPTFYMQLSVIIMNRYV